MKAALTTGGVGGGLVATVAQAGGWLAATLSAVALAAIIAVCWMITSRDRTLNAVAIIAAARGQGSTAASDRRPWRMGAKQESRIEDRPPQRSSSSVPVVPRQNGRLA